jgi:hypothetical protein
MVKPALLICLAGALAVGCGSFGQHECTSELRFSVSVRVLDESGTAVTGAHVTFSVAGGAVQDCEALSDFYACGGEQVGHIAVVANKMGYDQAQGSVTVGLTDDGCHVAGKQLVLQLVPSAT